MTTKNMSHPTGKKFYTMPNSDQLEFMRNETLNNKQGFWLVFISNNDILYIVATKYQEPLVAGTKLTQPPHSDDGKTSGVSIDTADTTSQE